MASGTGSAGASAFSRERETPNRDEERRKREEGKRYQSAGGAKQEKADEHQRDAVREALRARFFDPNMATAYLLENKAAPREWVVEDLIPAHEGGLIIGAGGAGKGHMQIRLARSIATGMNFGRFNVPAPMKVLMVSREDDGAELHRRIRAAVALHDPIGFGEGEPWRELLEQNLHVVDIRGIRGVSIDSPELLDILGEKVGQLGGVKLVMLDPLGRLLPDEVQLNAQEGAGRVHAAIDEVVAKLDAGVSVAHHVSKIGRSTRPGDDRGAGASSGSHLLEDLARWVLRLVPMSGPEAKKKYDLSEHESYVEVTAPKTNYSATPSAVVFRRGAGGALDHEKLRAPLDVIDDRVLELLVEAGPDGLTRDDWEAAGQAADPKIAKNAAKSSRQRLVRAGKVASRDQDDESEEATGMGRAKRPGKPKQVFYAV